LAVYFAVGQRCVIECVGVFLATSPLPERFGFVVTHSAIISTFAVIVSVVRIWRGIGTNSVLFVTIVLVSNLRSIFGFRFVRKLLPSFLVNIVLFISSYLRFGQWTLYTIS